MKLEHVKPNTKNPRVLLSMTESEAMDLMSDLSKYKALTGGGELQATWKALHLLRDWFQGQMIIVAQNSVKVKQNETQQP